MAHLKITDAEAPIALAAIEGERWWTTQNDDRASPYGFFVWLEAARKAAASGATAAPGDFVEGGDGAIYGEGGWRRYGVRQGGELVLMSWSATAEGREKAAAHGIRVI